MKKLLFLIVAGVLSSLHLAGQEPSFQKGDKVLNLGLGLGSTFYTGSHYRTMIPPISASLEFGIVDEIAEKGVIGIGPYVGFSHRKYQVNDWGWKYTDFILGGRGSFHYPFLDKLDTYAGLLIGFNISTSKQFGNPAYDDTYGSGGLVWAGFVGGRYYFSDAFAGMLELGYGIAYLNLGVALKF